MAKKMQQLETGKIVIPPGPRLGERVIRVERISKQYEGRVLFENISFELVRPRSRGREGASREFR